MNVLKTLLMATLITAATAASTVVTDPVDLKKYAGKWYVIGFIPTLFDENWDYTTETYTPNEKGDVNIYTTYRKNGKAHAVRSKGFVDKDSGNRNWKVQFVWPFRASYNIIELDENYSYTVVGHPQQHFLYIMAREPKMNDSLYNAIVERCAKKGYHTGRIRKQVQEE